MRRQRPKVMPLDAHGFRTDEIAHAWAGGLFEGEGCISLGIRGDGLTQPSLSLVSTDKDTVRRFHAVIGCGHSIEIPAKSNRRVYWMWSTRSKHGVMRGIDTLSPYLGERRLARAQEVRARAEELTPAAERTHCKRGHLLEGDNVYRWAKTPHKRQCVACRRDYKMRYRAAAG